MPLLPRAGPGKVANIWQPWKSKAATFWQHCQLLATLPSAFQHCRHSLGIRRGHFEQGTRKLDLIAHDGARTKTARHRFWLPPKATKWADDPLRQLTDLFERRSAETMARAGAGQLAGKDGL